MHPDAVMELAEQAALFLRRLVDEGVRMEDATRLTASFISAHVLTPDTTEPKKPWEMEEA